LPEKRYSAIVFAGRILILYAAKENKSDSQSFQNEAPARDGGGIQAAARFVVA
jgi:hypothetical protein